MTKEEKLEEAKRLYKTANSDQKYVLERLFPELKESEDEKIMEALIDGFKRYDDGALFNGCLVRDIVAWLEKQGEPINEEKVLIGARKHVALSIMNFIDRCTLGMCLSNMECKDLEDAVVYSDWSKVYEYMKKKLEKQSEQKPVNEHKFNIGDWITRGEHYTYKIIAVGQGLYVVNKNNKEEVSLTFKYIEKYFHLWTIQDAKAGDVLVNGSNIFIFHFLNPTRLMGYCHINADNGIFYDDIGKNECFCLIDAVVNPATKEQRELLFQKMKEAGYEWDAENLELKKIEQKPAEWSEEDEKMLDEMYEFFDKHKISSLKHDMDDYAKFIKSLKDRYAWKPSNEQMDALESAVSSLQSTALESLYQKLNKLM